ncbi:MAG: tRNA uracil 4-sulfurtransferase ThiI [Candidatus Krumholzibacteriia bacterium]
MKFLIRLSPDITTKADRTRRRFMRMLVDNLRDAFRSEGIAATVEPGWVRLVVESDDARVEDVAPRVFGVHSLSRVEERDATDLDRLVDAATPHFRPRMEGRTFAIRARTAGRAGFRSRDVEVALGARLAPHGKVQLDDPDVTCHVEVRDAKAYLFCDSIRGWRGLPVGSEGRAVALLSGGFDSAVASWMVMRRGVGLDYVFCRLGGPVHTQGALRVLHVLAGRWSYGSRSHVHIVPFEDVVEKIRASCRPSMWQLVLKRFMYRTAQHVVREARGQAIVTGEALAQVSSQTLKNLRALDGRLDVPLLRPLLGLDKEEIIERSRTVGTCELSATVQEYCAIVPNKPAVAAKPFEVAEEEAKVELDFDALLSDRRVLKARRLSEEDWAIDDLEIDEIPEGAAVLDLRGELSFTAWHYPGAARVDLGHALKHLDEFDRRRAYVLYCQFGLKSAYLAEHMREAGLAAHNFRGGMRNLIRYAADRDLVPFELLPTDTWL